VAADETELPDCSFEAFEEDFDGTDMNLILNLLRLNHLIQMTKIQILTKLKKESTKGKRLTNKQVLDAVNLENKTLNSEDDEAVPKKSKKQIRTPNKWNKNRAKL
jgi:hypothetical protein